MTAGLAVVLLGLGLLVWPVPTAADRRLRRLRHAARLGGGAPGPVGVAVQRVDRARTAAWVGVTVAAVAAGTTGGVAVGMAAGAGAGAVAVVVLATRSARHQARRRRDLLTALAVLRGELDAGVPFPDALRSARDSAGTAVAAFDLGAPGPGPPARAAPDAGGPAATVISGDAVAAVADDAVAVARRSLTAGAGLVAVTGASWSAVAAGIGRDVAAHDAREREVASALAGARASTVVLAGLPVLGLGLAAALGADPLRFLLRTPAGTWVLAAGAALDLLGVLTSSVVSSRAAR